jgi:Leucine-rich repeat (LRR) protein
MITDALIKRESGQYDPEVVQRLRLEGLGISRIANLGRCSSLVELNLSRNELGEIAGLDTLITLQRLDLSHNKIKRIGDFLTSLALCFFCSTQWASTHRSLTAVTNGLLLLFV